MRKKRTTKKKMSTGAKVAIGVAVVGGGYLAWEYLVKPMINKDKPEEPKTPQEAEQQATSVINAVQQIPANTAPKNRLSPIGTPFDKINYDAKIWFGDKGAEVKFIQIYLNKAMPIWEVAYDVWARKNVSNYSGLKKHSKIAEDGIYGKETYDRIKWFFDIDQRKKGITPKMAVSLYKNFKDNQTKDIINIYAPAWASGYSPDKMIE